MRSNYKIDNQTYTRHVQISQATNINNIRFSILIQKKKKEAMKCKNKRHNGKEKPSIFLEKVHNVTLNVSRQKETCKKKKRNISYTVCVSFSRLFINSVCCNFSIFLRGCLLAAGFLPGFFEFVVLVSDLIVTFECIVSHVPWHSFVISICFSIGALLFATISLVSLSDCNVLSLFVSSISCNRSSIRLESVDGWGLFLHPMLIILWISSTDFESLAGINTIEFSDTFSNTLFPFSII